jgi:hypothetical protein
MVFPSSSSHVLSSGWMAAGKSASIISALPFSPTLMCCRWARLSKSKQYLSRLLPSSSSPQSVPSWLLKQAEVHEPTLHQLVMPLRTKREFPPNLHIAESLSPAVIVKISSIACVGFQLALGVRVFLLNENETASVQSKAQRNA